MATDLNFKNTNKSEDVDITELDYLYKSMRNIDKDSVLVKKWIENNKIIQGTEDLLKMYLVPMNWFNKFTQEYCVESPSMYNEYYYSQADLPNKIN